MIEKTSQTPCAFLALISQISVEICVRKLNLYPATNKSVQKWICAVLATTSLNHSRQSVPQSGLKKYDRPQSDTMLRKNLTLKSLSAETYVSR